MAKWTSSNILRTNIGNDILSRVQAGVGTITVTKVMTGSGRVALAQLLAQTVVTTPQQQMVISRVKPTDGGSIIELQLSNGGLATPYTLNQIGIYVTHPDYTGEQLYMIAQCDEGFSDDIPLPSETPLTMTYSFYLSHNGTSNVSITPNLSGYATVVDFDALVEEVGTKQTPTGDLKDNVTTFTQSASRTNLTTGEKLSISLGKIMKFLTDLKTVAFTGSYTDLTNKPTTMTADGGDADTITGFTVGKNVPSNALFTDTVYVHPTTSGNKHIPSGGSTGQILQYSADGTATWITLSIPTYSAVTNSVNGLMLATDKVKLDGIANNANNYTHPKDANTRHVTDAQMTTWDGKASTATATTSANGLLSSTDKAKIDGVAPNANNYTHPNDANTRHVTDAEKTTWNAKASTSLASDTTSGLMSPTDKAKVDGLASGATKTEASATNGNVLINGEEKVVYTHPSGTNPHGTTKTDVGLGSVPNVSTNDQTPTFTETAVLTALSSGEKLSIAFGKIAKAISSLISHIGDSVIHVTSSEKSAWNGKASTSVATTNANGLLSSTDKTKLDGVASNANNYSHPTGDGNSHVPSTGTTNNGKFLKAGSTANSQVWSDLPNVSASVNGLMYATDKSKLDGIENGANNYTHPSSHPYNMLTGAPSSLPANGGNSSTVGGFTLTTSYTIPTTLADNTICFVIEA